MMRVESFVGKVSLECLKLLDGQVNEWLETSKVEPRLVTQTFAYEGDHFHGQQQPVIVVSIWY